MFEITGNQGVKTFVTLSQSLERLLDRKVRKSYPERGPPCSPYQPGLWQETRIQSSGFGNLQSNKTLTMTRERPSLLNFLHCLYRKTDFIPESIRYPVSQNAI